MAWKFVGSCIGDSYMINGVDIFKEEWENTGESAQVLDPLYGQRFTFNIYTIKKSDKIIKFATGEFSNNVFGVYIKE